MMNVPISIDLREVIEEFNLSEDQSTILGASIIDKVIEEYSYRWGNLVNMELHQSRNEYKKAMYVDRESPFAVTFGLSNRESKLALMEEEGASPFDEKLGFEKSSKVKQKKDGGWFLTIPFRHATPQAVAESEIFSSVLPQVIYNLARNSTNPIKKNQLPEIFQVPGIRREINVPGIVVPEYIHRSSQYEGLVRVDIASTENENRHGYFTFRRVSDKSDPNSWWNGGLIPKKLMDKALEVAQIDRVADMAIDEFLSKI